LTSRPSFFYTPVLLTSFTSNVGGRPARAENPEFFSAFLIIFGLPLFLNHSPETFFSSADVQGGRSAKDADLLCGKWTKEAGQCSHPYPAHLHFFSAHGTVQSPLFFPFIAIERFTFSFLFGSSATAAVSQSLPEEQKSVLSLLEQPVRYSGDERWLLAVSTSSPLTNLCPQLLGVDFWVKMAKCEHIETRSCLLPRGLKWRQTSRKLLLFFLPSSLNAAFSSPSLEKSHFLHPWPLNCA